ncbi:MAG: dTDP-glucose 4,6-dehydratase [Alistipes sp.]|nr:dTDP-glucose 4,6-dehydratase [Alistipes sp.]
MERKSIMVTGGAGFIGSHLVRRLVGRYPTAKIVVFDALTYAGNLENLEDISGAGNYTFIKGDINDPQAVREAIETYGIDTILNLAAESHVDRSITDPLIFARTNVMGTLTLLHTAKEVWKNEFCGKLFYHISTDEVYGLLGLSDAPFTESTPYSPRSPYSASKASSDHFVRAFGETYGMPVIISNCSNNYGPYQFPEKLIPLTINNIRQNKPIPVYGTGRNVRDWLYVEDHAQAIDLIMSEGVSGRTYNIGGDCEVSNIEVVRSLIEITDRLLHRPQRDPEELISFVKDRSGHDLRYAIDYSRIKDELGWQPETPFRQGLEKTVAWYLNNGRWLESVTSGDYLEYYGKMYGGR